MQVGAALLLVAVAAHIFGADSLRTCSSATRWAHWPWTCCSLPARDAHSDSSRHWSSSTVRASRPSWDWEVRNVSPECASASLSCATCYDYNVQGTGSPYITILAQDKAPAEVPAVWN